MKTALLRKAAKWGGQIDLHRPSLNDMSVLQEESHKIQPLPLQSITFR